MDDTEDDARYPPNPYPQTNRRPFTSSNFSNLYDRDYSYPSQIPRAYSHDYADEDEEDEQNEVDLAMNDPEQEEQEEEEEEVSNGRDYHQTHNEIEADDDDDDVDDDDDDEDSSDSRGKRRRLDRYELVPRTSPSLNPLQFRTSSADWSEDSTFALLDVWGDRYLKNGRKSLRSDEWGEVAKKVSQVSKTPRSEIQCRNRLDTLKKKYKKEKAKYSECSSASSNWIYFQKLDELMSSPVPAVRLRCGIDAGEYVFANSMFMDEMRDSPGDSASQGEDEEVDDESDGLPPKREKVGGNSDSSFKMLDVSIQKFGAVYEKIETSKRQQMAELERMRKEFHWELELQKSQILDRAQAEIARLRQENGDDDEERTDEDDNGDDDDIDVSTENIIG